MLPGAALAGARSPARTRPRERGISGTGAGGRMTGAPPRSQAAAEPGAAQGPRSRERPGHHPAAADGARGRAAQRWARCWRARARAGRARRWTAVTCGCGSRTATARPASRGSWPTRTWRCGRPPRAWPACPERVKQQPCLSQLWLLAGRLAVCWGCPCGRARHAAACRSAAPAARARAPRASAACSACAAGALSA